MTSTGPLPPDELDIIGILLALKRNLVLIIGVMVLAVGSALLYLAMTPPQYQAQTVFMVKKGDEGKESGGLLGRLGGMGGNMAALAIGNAGSSLQDRAEFILKSRELAEIVAGTNPFMPRLFPERWDAKAGKWKPDGKEPSLEDAVLALRAATSVGVKKGFFTFTASVRGEPALARDLIEAYLKALNDRIRTDAKKESQENRAYLEEALRNTLDPTVQEKIQNRIAFEIEKYMLVATNSLDILEKPVVPRRKSAPNSRMVLILALLSGAIGALALVGAKEFAAKLRIAWKRRGAVPAT